MQEIPTVQQPTPPQQPPLNPPPTYQPPQKLPPSNKRFWLIIGIVAAIMLVVGIFIGYIARAQSQTTTISPTTQTTQQVTTQPTQPPVTQPPATQVPQANTIGKPYDAGYGWTVTVNSVRVSMGDQYYGPKPGQRFIVVNVSIKNQGTQNLTVSSSIFQLRDSTGQGYHGTYDPSSSDAPDGQVLPGHVLRGDMVFEVPSSEKHVAFILVPMSHPDATTEWQLTVP